MTLHLMPYDAPNWKRPRIIWSRIPRLFGKRGITLPPFGILLDPVVMETKLNLRGQTRLVAHEWCHWTQYRTLGFVRTYVGYVFGWLRHGYRNHPREIEARSYGNEYGKSVSMGPALPLTFWETWEPGDPIEPKATP